MLPTTAIILAGGLGTRLRRAVPDLPKPMAPIRGRPFLEYLLDYWIDQGIRRAVLSVGHMHRTISSHFGTRYGSIDLEYCVEETPQGTGGGLLCAMRVLNDEKPFLLLNGDTFFSVDLSRLAGFGTARDADCVFSLFRHTDSARYMGIRLDAEGRVERLAAPESGFANGGVYLVKPSSISGALVGTTPVSLENELLPEALASGRRLFGLVCDAPFIDIGIPADYLRAATVLAPP